MIIKVEWLLGGSLEYHTAIVPISSIFELVYVLQESSVVKQIRVEGATPHNYGYCNEFFSKWVTSFDYSSMKGK